MEGLANGGLGNWNDQCASCTRAEVGTAVEGKPICGTFPETQICFCRRQNSIKTSEPFCPLKTDTHLKEEPEPGLGEELGVRPGVQLHLWVSLAVFSAFSLLFNSTLYFFHLGQSAISDSSILDPWFWTSLDGSGFPCWWVGKLVHGDKTDVPTVFVNKFVLQHNHAYFFYVLGVAAVTWPRQS